MSDSYSDFRASADRAALLASLVAPDQLSRLLNRIPPTFSPLEKVALLMVSEDTPPTLKRLAKAEVARAHMARREHEARSGVCWSGMDADAYEVKSVDALVVEAARIEATRTHIDVALKCELLALAQAGSHEADRVLSAADRGDTGWQDQARALVSAQARRAA